MPPVGRPRTSTSQGARPPQNLIGVADPFNFGVSTNPANGQVAPWRQFIDTQEDVPEWFWPNSLRTIDHMRTDSQLSALLTSVMWGICQLRFIIEPNGAKPSLIKEISEDFNLPVKGEDDQPLGRMKKRFAHGKFVQQALLSVLNGHAFFEQNGDIVDGKWRLRKLFPIMPRTIAQINVADDGGLMNVVQWASRNNLLTGSRPNIYGSYAEPIPVERLTGFIFQQEGFNWHGRSMLRDCFKDWVLKDRLLRIEAINHERAGGVPYAEGAVGMSVAELEDLGQMMQQFRIGETAGGAVPNGASIHIAKGSGSDIDRTIQRYDQSMARRFLLMLANLAQGGQHVGSYALGETFEDFFLVGQRHITQWYCDVVNEHIIEDIVDWNYGEDEDLVPKLTWERTSEDSLGTEQLATLVQRGVIIVDEELENAIRYKYQLPKRSNPRPEIIVGPGVPRQPQELAPGQTTPPRGEYPESQNPVPATTQAAGVPSGAPSSGTPAPTRASRFWRKKTPDVMAVAADPQAPVLVTVPNVPILHAGIEYALSTGPRTFTPEDLLDAVMAANEDPSIPQPRLKIGHVDPRFNDPRTYDGSPSFGKATNLRLSENGTSIYADYVGVPKWLADIMPTAYPSRSIEGYSDVPSFAINGIDGITSQTGKHWRFVISACSLLGVEWPGISVLEDLPQYYGAEMPSDVQIVDPALLSATGGDPSMKIPFVGTAASANLDDVRRSFYSDYVPNNPDANWWWIQAILVDPNELVVEDDETGQLYKMSFKSTSKGNVNFGEPQAVRIDYVPAEAQKAAAAHVAAALAVGREVMASWDNREDSVLPQPTESGGSMDPKQIRARLGLPEDASDEQVQQTLHELNAAAGIAPPQDVPVVVDPAATPLVVEPSATPPVEQPAALPIAATGAVTTPPGTVLVDKAQWDTIVSASAEASSFLTEQRKRQREDRVAAAMAEGRIAPASKDHWLKLLETDPNAAATLDSLEPGLIPVDLRGHGGGTGEPGDDGGLSADLVGQWTERLFPETRDTRSRDLALATGGQVDRRPRITADGNYRKV